MQVDIQSYPPVSIKDFFEKTARLGTEKINIYKYQTELFENTEKFRLINKARQIGISTAVAMEALYKAIWFPNKTILFISTGERTSRELMEKVKTILNTIEPFTIVVK